jgi:hypothetical protein
MHANREAALDLLKDHLSVIATKGPIDELGDSFEEAEKCFQAIACSNLLLFADQERFRRNLVWVAYTRRRFLVRCRDEGVADFRRARSRSDAVFCSLAAADLSLAREVSDLSPMSWISDGEYEDDFAYHDVLHHLISPTDRALTAGALDLFETALGDSPTARLGICRALHDRDVIAFAETFRAFSEANAQAMTKDRPRFADDPTFEPRSYVYVEGLALLRLAVESNLAIDDAEYPLCPSIGRLLPVPGRPEDVIVMAENA